MFSLLQVGQRLLFAMHFVSLRLLEEELQFPIDSIAELDEGAV